MTYQPDTTQLRVLDLFSGIGGFSLGLERAGMMTVAFCEIDEQARQVLAKHWPDIPCFADIMTLSKGDIGVPIDVICGGFPCQDISLSGAGAGLDGARSGLWWEYHRLIRTLKPKYAVIENVSALRSRGLDRVLWSLAAIGYDAEWHCIPASAVGASHDRDRIWIIAYPHGTRRERLVTREAIGLAGQRQWRGQEDLQNIRPYERGDLWPQPIIRRMDDAVPRRVDRLKQVGNAVIPTIPEIIGNCIQRAEIEDLL